MGRPTTFIALIRGVNITGNNVLPMKSLTALLEKMGCAGVRTYLQSGNAVFQSAATDRARLCQALTAAIEKAHGFAPRVMLITAPELGRAMRANPFPQAGDNPKTLHLFFLDAKPSKADLTAIAGLAANGEQFHLQGRVFYLYTPNGFGTSKLATRAERLLGVAATARNWRTVTSLADMAK
jgi:uncharacterized protein (DUF1697 family)